MTTTFQYAHRTSLLLLLALAGSVQGIVTQAPIALVVLNCSTETKASSPVLEFAKVDYESAIALRVITSDGRSVSLTRSQIALVFRYPDSLAPLTSTKDVQALSAKRAEAVGIQKTYVKAAEALNKIIIGIDSDIQKLNAGQVRYSGHWQPASDQETGTATSGSSVSSKLRIKEAIYLNPSVARLDNGGIILAHDGGIVRIAFSDASPELLQMVRTKSDLFKSTTAPVELSVNGTVLSNARLVGINGEVCMVLHDKGLITCNQKQIAPELLASMMQNSRGLGLPSSTAKDENLLDTRTLLLPPGEGSRKRGYGWQCSAQERLVWEAANGVSLDNYEYDDDYLKKLFSGEVTIDPSLPKLDLNRDLDLEEPIQFINSKIRPHVLGFGTGSTCLIIRRQFSSREEVAAVLEPALMNATVKAQISGDRAYVIFEGLNGQDAITLYRATHKSEPPETLLWHDSSTEVSLPILNPNDAARVARALTLVLTYKGAKASSF